MAEKRKVGKKVIRVEPKERKQSKKLLSDEHGMVEAAEIIKWFRTTYPESQRVDRGNGIVYHLRGRKVVKEPTFENKGGIFFGAKLNSIMKAVSQDHPLYVLYHSKSNVYKCCSRLPLEALERCQEAILCLFPAKGDVG